MIYENDRAKEDLKFISSYRTKWIFFNSKEERLWHKAKWWGCWLRHHRQMYENNFFYLFLIMNNRDSKEFRAFEYINNKKKD